MSVRAASDKATAKPSRSVLVVDDDPLQRLQLTDTLSDLGIEVLQEEEGAAALETMRTARPAVVIMDVRMPVLDGIAAAQAMADLDYKPRVILMTGDPSLPMRLVSSSPTCVRRVPSGTTSKANV